MPNYMKHLKDVATVVASVAGIVTGIDKIKTTLEKWNGERKEKAKRKGYPPLN